MHYAVAIYITNGVCVSVIIYMSLKVCLLFYIKNTEHHVSMLSQDDKSPFTI